MVAQQGCMSIPHACPPLLLLLLPPPLLLPPLIVGHVVLNG
jgi:hypothetical protein